MDNTKIELLNDISEINNRKATFIIIIFFLIFLLLGLILYLGYLVGNKNNNCYDSENMIGKYEIDNAIVDDKTKQISCNNCRLILNKDKYTLGKYYFDKDLIINDPNSDKLVPNSMFYEKTSN